MVPLDEVHAGEELATVELVGEVQDAGQGLAVVLGGEVEAAVMAAGSPRAILLAYHVERGGTRQVRAANDAGSLYLAELSLGCA